MTVVETAATAIWVISGVAGKCVGVTSEEEDTVESLRAAALVSDAHIAALAAEVEQLHAAMESRSTIEQAKGVLMHSMGIGPEAAFAVLIASSQRENRKLREIADEIARAQDGGSRSDVGA